MRRRQARRRRFEAIIGPAGLALAFGLMACSAVIAAEPVPYLGACPTLATNSFVVPGTDTCLRVGGSLVAEYGTRFEAPRLALAPTLTQAAPRPSFATRNDLGRSAVGARLTLDARTETELGPIRTFISLRRPLDRP